MSTTPSAPAWTEDLYRDGIIALRGALPPEWADRMLEDFEVLYAEAEERDRASGSDTGWGRVPRGPNRFYMAVHPERLRGFRELVTNPSLDAVCREVLGDDYQYVEVGFDVALPGARRQPLHRDFPTPEETLATGRFSSLAVNASCVDVTPEMGPLEIVAGTHFDDSSQLEGGMKVPAELMGRYEGRIQPRMARRGDVSVRTGLTIHRGTANVSSRPRPVLILGVMGAAYETFADHELTMTPAYYRGLPEEVRAHLGRCTLSQRLEPIVQDYVLDFLLDEG